MDTSEEKKLQYYVSLIVAAFLFVHLATICWRSARLYTWGFSDRILSFFSAESNITMGNSSHSWNTTLYSATQERNVRNKG